MLTDRIYRALRGVPVLQAQARRVVKRLPHRLRIVERRGRRLRVDPSEMSGFYLYYEQEYDDPIFAFLDKRSRYATVFDVGANIGIYTCYFSDHADRVLSFEPDPSVLGRLNENIALNNLPNVTVHAVCVGKEHGTAQFFQAVRTNTGVGGFVGTGEMIETPCVPLDDFAPGVDTGPCLVKMDIEGAEWLALQGVTKLLGRPEGRIDLLLETHPESIRQLGGSLEEIAALFLRLGFSLHALAPEGLLPIDARCTEQRFWWASR